MVSKRITRALILIVSALWYSVASAELLVSHRLIATKAVENGTQITFHLQLVNHDSFNYVDLTISPVDPALLLTPNETTVSINRLDIDQHVVIPWKVTLPFAAGNFHSELPIAFQGSATDEFGNAHTILIFSYQEAQ
jgi:hypothetical protein